MKKILILTIYIAFSTIIQGQTIIKGQAKSYANKTIKLYTQIDWITFTPKLIDSCLVDSLGNFSFSFHSSQINNVYIDLNTKYGALLTEPQKTYLISLPPYESLSIEQILNPYFSPKNILLPLLNIDSTDINWKIRLFDYYFKILRNQLISRKIQIPDSVEFVIEHLDKKTSYDTSLFFTNYKIYRYASLRLATYMRDLWAFVDEYFLHQAPQFNNPAYMSLFNNVFDNCLSPSQSFFPTTHFLKSINYGNFDSLVNSFMTLSHNFNRKTAQLIILKGLYDLFYEYEPAQTIIIKNIENAYKNLRDSTLSFIAKNILLNITALRPSYPAPNFSFTNKFGIKRSLKNFKGKFIYLNFCHYKSIECQKQMDLLERYSQNAPKDFEIITIIYGLNNEEFKQFLKKHKNYTWTIFNGQENKELLKKYKVKAFPTYYLISPEGNILLNPAPMPTENFEQIFTNLYKKWHQTHLNTKGIQTNY